jgi:hypothetical protein
VLLVLVALGGLLLLPRVGAGASATAVTASGFEGTVFRRHFAEGAATSFFDCYFALANPNLTTPANVTLHFLRDDSQTFSYR